MTGPPGEKSSTNRLIFVGLVLLNLIVTVLYTRSDVLSNDDFYSDPGHLYPRDGRWGVIPWLSAVDTAFATQQVAKPLAWLVLAVTAATLATQIARLVATFPLLRGGVALITSLALMAAPNLMWGPGMWYNAIAFFWVTVALVGMEKAVGNAGSPASARWGAVVFILGVIGAGISYQPFAIIPILLWLSLVASRRPGVPLKKQLAFLLGVPLAAGAATVIATLSLALLSVSSRLDQAATQSVGDGLSVGSLLLAYGRPAQVALLWATVVVGVAIVWHTLSARSDSAPRPLLGTALLLGTAASAYVVLPLVLADARLDRFASSVQISILIALVAHAAHLNYSSAQALESRSSAAWWSGGLIALTTLASGATLVAGGYPSVGGTLGVIVGVWVISLTTVWVLSLPTSPQTSVGLFVISSLLVSHALVRDQLYTNWLAIGLDREVASHIALELTRMNLSETETVTVNYDTTVDAAWYSPLLRVNVAGPEMLAEYLSALNNVDFTVVHSPGLCPTQSLDFVTAELASPTEVNVCVDLTPRSSMGG